jgi:hypothetical protein
VLFGGATDRWRRDVYGCGVGVLNGKANPSGGDADAAGDIVDVAAGVGDGVGLGVGVGRMLTQ